jgi:cobalt-zinc-cadmium efflux system outer membrane protein
LGLDYSKFDPDAGRDDNGYSVSISQPIRLWGVADNKKALSLTKLENASISQKRKKAIFIRDISLSFAKYAQQKMLISLGKDEQEIADKIYDIAHARFSAGSVAKKEMLQALSSKQMSEVETKSLELEALGEYYTLLQLAGISEDIELNTSYDFEIESSKNQNPDLLLLQNQKKSSLAMDTLASNKIEWINLNANYEKEYEQDISSLGISLPLAIFNTKSQEKNIAKLKTKQAELLIENKHKNLNLALQRLKRERKKLLLLKAQNGEIVKTQENLLNMFEAGYKVSKSNLLELQDIKNQLIESKKRLIFIKTSLNQNAINTNYMQGAYNE